MIQIRKPRWFTLPRLVFCCLLGFGGGFYIWEPVLRQAKREECGQQAKQLGEDKQSFSI